MGSRFGGSVVFALIVAATPVLAQSAQISLGAQAVQSDGTIQVPIQLSSGGLQIAAIQLDILFDSSVMALTSSAGSAASNASKTIENASVSSTDLRIVVATDTAALNQNSIPDGTLITLVITPASSGFSGTLYVSNAIASDPSGTGLAVSAPGPPPPPATFSILNGASQQGGAISPGEIVSLYQTGILPSTAAVSDVSVMFNGKSAPILYAGANQINAVTPFELAAQSTATIVVTYQGSTVGQNTVPVSATSPGLFSMAGSQQGVIINSDGTLNSASNPAAAGSIVYFYATGAGVFQNPALGDGQITSANATPTSTPVATVAMGLGTGKDIKITYKGPAPGFIAGLMQVNFLIPPALTPNPAVPLTITVGGVQSQAITLAVH